jgi:hypothetical protein
MLQKYFRVLLILGMAAVICGTVSAEGMGIIAETHETSGVDAPVCTAPCQCMAETAAIAQWGVNGYEMCSKTICGQSADASVQYHCIHQTAAPAAQSVTNAPAQVPVQSAAVPAAPPAAGVTQKSPAGIAIVFTAMGAALLAAAAMRRK